MIICRGPLHYFDITFTSFFALLSLIQQQPFPRIGLYNHLRNQTFEKILKRNRSMTSTFPQIDLQYLRNRKNYGLKKHWEVLFCFIAIFAAG